MTAPLHSPHDWSKDAIFTKAQRYAEEMLRFDHSDWRFGLWSSLCLEALARAALAHISPTLLADPKDWNNLFFALGHSPTASKFSPKSVDISAVLSRLKEVMPAFTPDHERFCVVHMGKRNEEVHSGSTPFDGVATSTWLPMFYDACSVLTTAIGEDLKSLVGKDEAKAALKLVTAAKDESAKAVKKTVDAHKTVWNDKDKTEQSRLLLQASTWAKKQSGHRVTCPACAADALVVGSPVGAPKQVLDNGAITESQSFLPTRFQCIACNLKIGTLAQLHAVGLGNTFTSTIAYDAAEYFRPDDPLDAYEPDFNEP